MTKPLTWLCLFLALGSGLFLYQTKHRAQLLDREIAQVMRAADAARARSGVLQAEYQLLSDPQRLASLATSHLSLRPTAPGQFSTWSDLERRLPPVGLPPADQFPAVLDASPETEFASADDLPVPPIPPSVRSVILAQAAPAPMQAAEPAAAPVMVATRPAPTPPRPAPTRMATLPNPVVNAVISSVMASAPRHIVLAAAPAYSAPAYGAPAYNAPAQSVGSSLGMARLRLPSPIGTANAASFSGGSTQ